MSIETNSLVDSLDQVLGALNSLFAEEGASKEVAVLALSKATIEETSFDRWDGGIYGYTVHLQIPPNFYAQLGAELEAIEKTLCEKVRQITRLFHQQFIEAFVITTELVEDTQWREKARVYLTGDGLTNQGRARSDNLAPRQCDGLLFRSEPEINLYRAFKSLAVSFAPLPVFIRGGAAYKRIEPDFLIIHAGMCMVVEVDGDTVHHETPEAAQNRLTMLTHEGAILHRVNANECDTPEKARECAKRALAVLEKAKSNR